MATARSPGQGRPGPLSPPCSPWYVPTCSAPYGFEVFGGLVHAGVWSILWFFLAPVHFLVERWYLGGNARVFHRWRPFKLFLAAPARRGRVGPGDPYNVRCMYLSSSTLDPDVCMFYGHMYDAHISMILVFDLGTCMYDARN